jgi:DNA ligase-4
MKPEYGDTVASIDVMIMGCHNGSGETFRGRGISTFTCAIKTSPDSAEYHSFCRVGTGYDFEQLRELREKLNPHLKAFNNKRKPEYMKHMKFGMKLSNFNIPIYLI